jgi:hypothetical protein
MHETKLIRFQKYLTIHWLLISLSVLLAWVTFYYPETSTLIQRCCFTENDPSWVPADYESKPIIGVHHFGDFELYRAWGLQENPYEVGLNAHYLPIFHIILRVLNILPLHFSFFLYVSFTFSILFFSIRHVCKKYALMTSHVLNIFLTFGVLSLPFIVDLDRGNLQTIVISLASVYMINILNGRKSLPNFLLILLCAAIKPYYLLFVIFQGKDLFKVKYLATLISYILVNFFIMHIFSSDFRLGFRNLFLSLSFYGSQDSIPYIQQSLSFVGSTFRIIEIFEDTETAATFLSQNFLTLQIISALISVTGIIIFLQNYLPLWVRFFSGISIISAGQIGSANYSLLWLTFLVILIIFEDSKLESYFIRFIQNKFIYIIVVLGLVPFWFVPQNRNAFYQTLPISIVVVSLNLYFLFLLAKHLYSLTSKVKSK